MRPHTKWVTAERVAKKKELEKLGPTLLALRSVYPKDTAFRAAFAEKIIRTTDSRNNRVVRFILCALEKHLSGQDYEFPSDSFNLEHVLPQSAPDGWGEFDNDDAEALIYRLGNMTLLESGTNRDLGTTTYVQKRAAYQKSGFGITRKLSNDNAEWTPERIAQQQIWMANQATVIWRVAQLS